MNFRVTGCLNNAAATKKENILPLAMYYKLGKFDPSGKHVKAYRNKNIYKFIEKVNQSHLTISIDINMRNNTRHTTSYSYQKDN